jgi:hypothetical protein
MKNLNLMDGLGSLLSFSSDGVASINKVQQETLFADFFTQQIYSGRMSVERCYRDFWSYEEDAELWGLPKDREWRAVLPDWMNIVSMVAGRLKSTEDLERIILGSYNDSEHCFKDSHYNPFGHDHFIRRIDYAGHVLKVIRYTEDDYEPRASGDILPVDIQILIDDMRYEIPKSTLLRRRRDYSPLSLDRIVRKSSLRERLIRVMDGEGVRRLAPFYWSVTEWPPDLIDIKRIMEKGLYELDEIEGARFAAGFDADVSSMSTMQTLAIYGDDGIYRHVMPSSTVKRREFKENLGRIIENRWENSCTEEKLFLAECAVDMRIGSITQRLLGLLYDEEEVFTGSGIFANVEVLHMLGRCDFSHLGKELTGVLDHFYHRYCERSKGWNYSSDSRRNQRDMVTTSAQMLGAMKHKDALGQIIQVSRSSSFPRDYSILGAISSFCTHESFSEILQQHKVYKYTGWPDRGKNALDGLYEECLVGAVTSLKDFRELVRTFREESPELDIGKMTYRVHMGFRPLGLNPPTKRLSEKMKIPAMVPMWISESTPAPS